MFTVSLSLPDCCDAGDFQDREPTPIDAVENFIAQMTGGAHQWVYCVKNDSTGEIFHVDMQGEKITKIEDESTSMRVSS